MAGLVLEAQLVELMAEGPAKQRSVNELMLETKTLRAQSAARVDDERAGVGLGLPPPSFDPPLRILHHKCTANTVKPFRYRGFPVSSGLFASRSHSQTSARVSSIWRNAVGTGVCREIRQSIFHELMGRYSATESRQRPDTF